MLTATLNAGFGHAVRFIAIVESLRKYSNIPVSCLVGRNMKNFISSNLSGYHCDIHNLYQLQSYIQKSSKKNYHHAKRIPPKYVSELQNTKMMLNDFLTNVDMFYPLFNANTINCCVYHGDITASTADSAKLASFKNLVNHTASKHDIFFHINLTQPTCSPKMGCTYIPTPVVKRELTMNKTEVNRILGLEPDEKFILIHAGSAVMENVYSYLYKFYETINHLKTPYKIVVASGIENNRFSFKSSITHAPLFKNGIDLVNASELVLSKPGMGILQDCIATKTPLLFLPGDFPERDLKIQLLDQLLGGNLPIVSKISCPALEESINQCLCLKEIYDKSYSRIPTNGADFIAKCLLLLKNAKKTDITDLASEIQRFNPLFCLDNELNK